MRGKDKHNHHLNQNKGFTLVEILLAITILAVATISIGAMIITTQNNTVSMLTNTELQQQSSAAKEALHNGILQTNTGIKQWSKASASASWSLIEQTTGDEQEILVGFYDLDTIEFKLTKHYYLINTTDNTIKKAELAEFLSNNNSGEVITMDVDSDPASVVASANWTTFAQNVYDFKLDVSNYKKNGLITFSMNFKIGSNEYPVEDVVYMRNAVTLNEPLKIEQLQSMRIPKPSLSESTFQYDGNMHEPVEVNFKDRFMTRSPDSVRVASAIGTYTITYVLKDKTRMRWQDGTTNDVILTWRISR